MPNGKGLWPAFWLLQQDGDWPPEIDVVEFLGRDPQEYYATVHTSQTGEHVYKSFPTDTVDLTTGFHRYGVNWQADYITFYLDGKQVGRVATPADLHEPMYMIVNLAVGGDWAGEPDAYTVFPATLKVDYIRAYSDLGAVTPSAGGGGGSTPTGAEGVVGTAAAELMTGAAARDVIYGEGGADTISGMDGDDYLRGGDGDDYITGGAGFDDVHGNAGNDTVYGGSGSDWVVGGQDNDQLFGDLGDDVVLGNLGMDTLYGGAGADTMRGGQQDDTLYGGDGDDWLSGDKGTDVVYGGAGADVFHGSSDTGFEYIMDFTPSQGDRIMLDHGTPYVVLKSGGDTVISLAGGASQMVLVGFTEATFNPNWIFLG